MADDDRPGHDPIAEEMDLLTGQEAAARLYDEITRLREEDAELRHSAAGSADSSRLAAVRARLRDLEAAAARIRQRSSPPLTR